MKRILALGVLGAALLFLAADTPYGPTVVSKYSATNLTSSISSTTIYTPSEDGDYSASCYVVLGTTGGFDADAAVALAWTDEYRSNASSSMCDANGGSHNSANQRVVHATSGNPITFSVTYGTGGGNTPYDVFITLVKQ